MERYPTPFFHMVPERVPKKYSPYADELLMYLKLDLWSFYFLVTSTLFNMPQVQIKKKIAARTNMYVNSYYSASAYVFSICSSVLV